MRRTHPRCIPPQLAVELVAVLEASKDCVPVAPESCIGELVAELEVLGGVVRCQDVPEPCSWDV